MKSLRQAFVTLACFLSPIIGQYLVPSNALAQSILRAQGTLADSDASFDNGSLFDFYIFSGKAGEQVTFNLNSEDFDTYLAVLDPNQNAVGENDNLNPSTSNSGLTLTLPSNGAYAVFVSTPDSSGRGRYSLTVGSESRSGASSTSQNSVQIPVEGFMNGDSLVTINGVPWAANDWPYSEVLATQINSVDTSLDGLVVLDRHGIDTQPFLGIKQPFAGPEPGRFVAISNWGSKDDGCYVELIFQIATTPNSINDASLLIPTNIAMVINGEPIDLEAFGGGDNTSVGRYFSFPYTYTVLESQNDELVNVEYPGVWIMARHLFLINAEQARILRSAPPQETRIRVTLRNRSPINIPIGNRTVERWSSVYSYNPSCRPN